MNICSRHKNRHFQKNISGRVRVTLQVFTCIPATAVCTHMIVVCSPKHEVIKLGFARWPKWLTFSFQ